MLLEFRFTNFRSFRDEAVFTLAASADTELESTHTRLTGLEKVKRVLNSAAIYGANASGKSNVIRALQFMQAMVMTSNQIQPDQESILMPFRLRAEHETHPSRFEITFLIERVRYQYGFELNRRQILNEWLLVYEKAKPQVWFSRIYNDRKRKYDYTYSDYFVGQKKVWEVSTRKEALYLTTAVLLNNEQLRPLYQRISEDLVIVSESSSVGFDFSASYIKEAANRMRVQSLIAAADTGISSVSVERRPGRQLHMNFASGVQEVRDAEFDIPQFGHMAGGKNYNFDISEESAGTQVFFGLAGPVLDILDKGRILVVDEIDRSLHPLLVLRIIQMFNDATANKNGAQLIFSTHDVSLMSGGKLRRDQIWFAEKDDEQASHLFPLLDFSPRKGEALEKGYLGGRYGGIPILG